MGAWGPGPFENDTALDFAGSIESLSDISASFTVEGAEEIDADSACEVVVAAECVAAMRGHPHAGLPDNLATIANSCAPPSLELFDDARNNISAVISRSELMDLWADADPDDRAAFNREMTDLVDRLNRPQVKPTKQRKPRKKAKVSPNPSPCMICDKAMGDGEFHQFSITLMADDMGDMRQSGWVHMGCLNAALHPKHMIQNWQFDDELLDYAMKKIAAEDAKD